MKSRILILVLSLVSLTTQLLPQDVGLVPLFRLYSGERGDYFTTTDTRWQAARINDVIGTPPYRYDRVEGRVFSTAQPGTVPLMLWYSARRGDNLTTADPAWRSTPQEPSYALAERGIEGYVFAPDAPQPAGTIPLFSVWSPSREDNFLTTDRYWKGTRFGERVGDPSLDYVFVRTEGYIYPAVAVITAPGPVVDLPFPGTPPPSSGDTLFGYVDMHTHPASFLGFGGREDGRQGMMWGRPAVGDGFRATSSIQRFGRCYPNDHSEMSAGVTNPDNYIKQMLRETIMSNADGRSGFPHTARGAPDFQEWPNSLLVSHQQIDILWLQRAHQGGLRMIVAAAVDNELVDTTYDWNFTRLLPILNDFFAGRSLRRSLGLPRPGFALESAIEQLRFLQLMVAENCDFMEIAFTGADARRIVSSGKLAVVLGVEMDTLTPADITQLVNDEGVRFVTPIHFVDNAIGGSAAYETMFSLLSGLIGEHGQPQNLVDDGASDFRMTKPFGPMQEQIDFLTHSALGWSAVASSCTADSHTGDRLGCSGKLNGRGLKLAGQAAVRELMSRGVMIDLAHMGQASQFDTLKIADELRRPVFDSHTGMRLDEFEEGATERSIPARFARQLLDLGGVIGVGTGTGEYATPRRIFYNAGNPLIDFRSGRTEWTLDLRQAELRQTAPLGTFSRYRVTLRIGRDDAKRDNTVTAMLLSRADELGRCEVVPRRRGAGAHTVVVQSCELPSIHGISEVAGFKIEHTAADGDNVDIDEVTVEADMGAAGFLTLLQRTGGNESEVVRLKGRGPEPHPDAFASHYWITRLLPRPRDLEDTITGLRIRTFTNQDDLGRRAPARMRVALSGHRESDAQTLVFATPGASSGTFTDDRMNFLSGGERLLAHPASVTHSGRERTLSFGDLTLGVGADEGGGLANHIVRLRRAAETGVFARTEVQVALGIAAVSSILAAVPLSPVLLLVGLVFALINEQHDNWSTTVAIDAVVVDAMRQERLEPILVGYNPMQRIKGAQAFSTLFRNLPERIDSNRLYSGMLLSFSFTTQVNQSDVNATDLIFGVGFQDGTLLTQYCMPEGVKLAIGPEYKTFIPFDKPRLGSELRKLVLSSLANRVLVRSLDVGLMEDPAMSFARAFGAFDSLGAHPTQLGIGSDLSGFEPLLPFSAFNPGFNPLVAQPVCAGTVVAGECRSLPPTGPVRDVLAATPRPPYALDIERFSGRSDPARAIPARSVPNSLHTARVDGASGRVLDFRLTGLSTIGQLPELAVTAAQADRVLRGPAATLGPQIFNSVDGMVRAWERLDVGAINPPTRPTRIPVCP